MQFALSSPVDCCLPCCRDTITLVTSGSGGVNPVLWGVEDPNVAGVTPANTSLWGTYEQLIAPGGPKFQTWDWNPDTVPQSWT